MDFTYTEGPAATFLGSISARGYVRNADNGSYSVSAPDGRVLSPLSLPPVEFTYTQAQIDETIKTVSPGDLMGTPAGVDGSRYRWVDLDGEGLPGILSEQANAWFYNRNVSGFPPDPRPSKATGVAPDTFLGERSVRPRFEGVTLVGLRPSTAALSQGQQLLDIAGEGHQCLVEYNRPMAGYYDRGVDGQWTQFTPFASLPVIAWNDPNLKHIDIDGDGHPDLLISEDEVFTWYPSLAKDGFGPANTVRKPVDEDRGAAIVFADRTESIYLADMSGDGLTDIARIRNGEVCYWPNLGYGLFGAKVTMGNAPLFDTPDQFDQKRIRLADIDGSGTTDVLYLGRGRATFWYNQSGNGFSEPHHLSQFPDVDNVATVAVVDLLGAGTSCIVWSSSLPGDSNATMRYIDLMAAGKPHLLTSVKNNLGAETRIRYVPSTRFYLQDRAEGRPWITRLAFPVQVVERSETYDYVSESKYASRYAYHHGYFDGVEREFRGFGMVEQWDADTLSRYSGGGLFTETPETAGEEFHLPPAHTKTWFHNGAFIGSDRISRLYAHEYYGADLLAWSLPDSRIPDSRTGTPTPHPDDVLASALNGQEMREACRALRGHVLRQEIYADDGSPQSDHPYSVSEHTYRVRMQQPLYGNRHASFYAFETETLTYHYERSPADPRIEHHVTIDVDDFGNVTKSATIGYPRRLTVALGGMTPVRGGPVNGKASHASEQLQTLIVYTDNSFANRADETDWRRIGLPVETRTYELTGIKRVPDSAPFGASTIRDAVASSPEIPYEAVPANRAETISAPTISRVSGGGLTGALPASEDTGTVGQKRLINHSRTLYLKDDLSGPLPVGQAESLGLRYESYNLALTPGLLKSVFSEKISDADLVNLLSSEGRYLDLDSNGSWWIPSGRAFFSADPATPDPAFARAHFYQPMVSRDPFGSLLRVAYDSYVLTPVRTEDALGNVSLATIDYRVLMPSLVTDPNNNRTAVAIDALGMVTATAVMGKEGQNEGDTLADPTVKREYDVFQWLRRRQPNFVHMLAREQHGAANPRWQEAYSYSDGLGREVMKKSQAPAGLAPVRNTDGTLKRDDNGKAVIDQVTSRWIGSGRVVRDNKGNPIKKYEPYFSSTYAFEDEKELVEQGVTPILRYDPVGRLIRTDMSDGTLARVEFDAWMQITYDANDTVLESRWYAERVLTTATPTDSRAARLAAAHANTPTVAHLDTLGRTCLSVADNGAAGKFETRSELDIDGQTLSVIDARGNRIMTQAYDMLGTTLHHASMEAGESQQISNVVRCPVRTCNSRGFQVRHAYDVLHRPTHFYVKDESRPERLAELFIYGDTSQAQPISLPGVQEGSVPDTLANNLRGKLFLHYDAAGVGTSVQYDFKGNLLQSTRQLLANYKDEVDWAANPAPTMETAVYPSSGTFDALNRHTTRTTPDQSVASPSYDEANHLLSMSVSVKSSATPTPYVTSITYDAKGQRERIDYGNGVSTLYDHDPLTFRLRTLKSVRRSDNALLQQLSYTYDPVGNIVEIRDDAQQTIYFSNQVVAPSSQYEYDPIYRLTSATGRERAGRGATGPPSPDDAGRSRLPHPNDGTAMTLYVERYEYDAVGNILRTLHNASGNGWMQRYDYDKTSNRLNASSLPSDADDVFTAGYEYDAAGNMTRMPHLPLMRWDYKNELAATSRQVVTAGTAEITYYVYSASGERMRKVTERQAAPGQAPTRKEERIYLGGFEIYRSYQVDGASIDIERETLEIVDDKQRIALVETRTRGTDPSPAQLTRYQFGNHIGSAVLELDDQAQIISYEEYYPYGCTAYQAVRSQIETPKRYRYTGKERDEESGLYYHGARYYAPWLARWTACDPKGITPDVNVYRYVANRPTALIDPSGTYGERSPLSKGGVTTTTHEDVKTEAAKYTPSSMGFSVFDEAAAKTDPDYLMKYKAQFVYENREAIKAAAAKYDLPAELVAGVVFNEFSVKKPLKKAVYWLRRLVPFTSDKDKTSLSQQGIQVRRAAEALGYDPTTLTDNQRAEVLASLADPAQSIFIAAKHLSDLRNVDTPGKAGKDLTMSDVKNIGARYNQGPDKPLADIQKDLSYGQSIANRWAQLGTLLTTAPPKVDYSPVQHGIVRPFNLWMERGGLNPILHMIVEDNAKKYERFKQQYPDAPDGAYDRMQQQAETWGM